MKTIKIWARIGTAMTIQVPDDYLVDDIRKATKKMIKQNNPNKPEFKFTGESYIPADNYQNIDGDDKDGLHLSDDIEFNL